MFLSQSLISSHRGHSTKREIHKGELHLSFRIPESHRKKKTSHVIPQSVHSMSFRKGNAKKKQSVKILCFAKLGLFDGLVRGQRERERSCNISFPVSQGQGQRQKNNFSDREKLFCSQGPISSHGTKREIHKRDLHLHFRSQNCRAKNIPFYPTKRSFHIIPQRECGETILQSLKNVFFAKPGLLMGWCGDRERRVATSLFQSHQSSAKKTIYQIAKKLFCPQRPVSSHKYKGSFPFPILESQCKKNDFIPKRVAHLFSFRKGNAEKFSERLKYFLQSRACLMGWPGNSLHSTCSQGARSLRPTPSRFLLSTPKLAHLQIHCFPYHNYIIYYIYF